ncbi:MAG: protein kinase [Planctomycetes bacterium]|nr:protein kinase [Planctomycetota bacterium]
MTQDEILNIAVKIDDPAEQTAFLDVACGSDQPLRTEIESLLHAHDHAGSFMAAPALDPHVTLDDAPLTEGPGTVIGKYKLLENIGEGGMGVVYMAEQKEPVRRKVALKIIKLGMDTKQVVARFEVERQALALMDHPNIAKVLDAGATDTGRPYFVMELVRGIPITEYCDKSNLNTRERLDLFIPICHAIQHAHQKGIIHRDIKPTNIMITLHDSKPVPKIIDFGIAKATNQQLTEKTLFTRYAQMVGTPEYMSPEQAEMSGLDIDTRSDIYSLGVLLYELLTGATPLDADTLRNAGYNQMQKIIQEQEPDKPSTKLSTMGQAAREIAKHRSTQPDALRKLVKGDLDLVVMKALDKERTRRYANASDLAADVERHLKNEPVNAAAPSIIYKLTKFTRRNRSLVASVAIIIIVLIAGIITSTMFAIGQRQASLVASDAEYRAENYRREVEQQRDQARETLALLMEAFDFLPTGTSGQELSQTFVLLGELSPEGVDYRLDLLKCFLEYATFQEAGQSDKAEESLQRALTLAQNLQAKFPNTPECQLLPALLHIDIGTVLTKSNRNDLAWEHFEQAEILANNLPKDERTKLKSNLAQNYYDLSSHLTNINADWDQFSINYMIKALKITNLLTSDFPKDAQYRERLDTYTQNAYAWARNCSYSLTHIAYDPSLALTLAIKFEEVLPSKMIQQEPMYRSFLSQAHYRLEQWQKARELSENSLTVGGAEEYDYLQLALIHSKLDDKEKALHYFNQFKELISKNPSLSNDYIIYMNAETELLLEIPDSELIYENNSITWKIRGSMLAGRGDWKQAVSSFDQAIKCDPDYPFFFNWKARAQVGNEDIEGYLQTCTEILHFHDQSQNYIRNRSIISTFLFSSEAVEDWDKLLDFAEKYEKSIPYPKWDDTNGLIGCIHYRAGNPTKALAKFEEAIEDMELKGKPLHSYPYTPYFLAMTHYKLGNIEEAHHWYKQGIEWMEQQDTNIVSWSTKLAMRKIRQEAEEMIFNNSTDHPLKFSSL